MNKVSNFLNEYGSLIKREKKVVISKKKSKSEDEKSISKAALNNVEKLVKIIENFTWEEAISEIVKMKSSSRKYRLHYKEEELEVRKKICRSFLCWQELHRLIEHCKFKVKSSSKITKQIRIPEFINFGEKTISLPAAVDCLVTEITHLSDIGINNRVIVQLLLEESMF